MWGRQIHVAERQKRNNFALVVLCVSTAVRMFPERFPNLLQKSRHLSIDIMSHQNWLIVCRRNAFGCKRSNMYNCYVIDTSQFQHWWSFQVSDCQLSSRIMLRPINYAEKIITEMFLSISHQKNDVFYIVSLEFCHAMLRSQISTGHRRRFWWSGSRQASCRPWGQG